MKGELEELGEESEGVENISKMQGQILNMTRGKVNIFDDAGNFKSTYDIMKEIAEVYDDLSSTERASLLETIAGKDRANDVAALLSNFDTAIAMVETAENSFGSASAENEKYLDSLQGRIDVMMASVQAFSASALDSGFLKGGVSAITMLIDGFTKLMDTVGLLPAAIGAVTAALSFFDKGGVYIDGSTNKLKIFGKTLDEIKDITGSLFSSGGIDAFITSMGENNPFAKLDVQMEKDKAAIEKYKELMTPDKDGNVKTTMQDALDRSFVGASASAKEYAQSMETANLSADEYEQSARNATIANQAQSNSFKSGLLVLNEYNKKSVEQRRAMAQSTEVANTSVGNYMAALDGADATLGGFAASTAKAAAKNIALKAATGLATGGLMMLGSMALDFVIGKFIDFINHAENVKKAVEEAATTFEQERASLTKNRQGYDEAVASYDKLASGVNAAGENVSLTTSEFEEYQNAANTIADMAPSMVAGFDAQGNAILKQSANVQTLTEAYNELMLAQADAILEPNKETGYEGLQDITENYINGLKDFNKDNYSRNLEKILNSNDMEATIKELSNAEKQSLAIALRDATGYKRTSSDNYTDIIINSIQKDRAKVKQLVDDTSAEYDSLAAQMKNAATALLDREIYGDAALSNMTDTTKNVVSQYIGGLDSEYYENLVKENDYNADKAAAALEEQIQSIAQRFASLNAEQEQALQDAFNASSDFESGEISISEFANKAKEVDKILSDIGFDKEEKSDFMATLGFEYNDDGSLKEFTKDYEAALNRFGGDKASKEIKDWLGGLSGGELDIVMDMELTGNETIDELQHALDLAKALNGVGQIDIAFETESLEKLNTAIQESNSASGLTADSIENITDRYSSLAGYDPAAIFEKTTTGVRLNEEALESLEEQYVATNKAAAEQSIDVMLDQYKELKKLRDEYQKGSDDWNKYNNQMDSLEDEIQNAQLAAAAYDGLTSAYNRWVNAKSTGEESDMYDSVRAETENMRELATQGMWGRNDLQSYMDMFFAEGSTDNWSAEDYAANFDRVVQLQDRYLTEGREGVDQWVSDISDEFMTLNENGDLVLKPGVEIEDIAKAKNVSDSFVEMMFGQANAAGYEFTIGIDQKSVDELVAESEAAAQAANDALKQYMGEDFEINASVTVNEDGTNNAEAQLEKLKQQRDEINNSDATVEVKEQGVEAVNSAIRAVIAQKIELEQPTFMSLDASQVDASMQDALAKAQEMQTAINNLNNLQLQQEYGIEIDQSQLDSANQKVQEIAQTIADNGELKMSLGFDENASVDDIKAKFQANEITISTKADTSQAESDIAAVDDNKTVDIQVNLAGDDKIAALESKMNAIDDKTINATVSLTGDDKIAALESKMNAIDNKTINATVSVQNTQAITALQNSIANIQSKAINVSVTVSNTPAVTALQNAINILSGKTVDVAANVTGTSEVNALTAAINKLKGKSVSVTASVSGTSSVNSLASAIAGVRSKTVTISANYTTTGNPPKVNGTAHVDGTANSGRAFKQGKWGTPDSGTALMGELGPELIVRGDQWFTVGDNGAGFYQYKKGDIIFNHKQTEELLKNGYVTASGGRGRAMAEGTAFASVSGGGKPISGWGGSSGGGGTTIINNTTNNYNSSSKSSSSKSSGSSSSKAKKEAKEFEETLDWIEIAIDRVERALDSLDRTASSSFKSFSEKNAALNQEMQVTRQEIELQQQAYERYMQQANSIGLSEDWASKVRDGTIDISVITDENLADQIKEFQEFYEKALDAQDAVEELNEQLGELAQQKFDMVEESFEGILGSLEYEQNMVENFVDRAEVDGQFVSKNFYRFLQDNVHAQAEALREQVKQMIAARDEAVNAGTMAIGDPAWNEMNNQINDVTVSIHKLGTQWAEYAKAIRETEWDIFDTVQDRISNIADEAQFLIDLMSNKKLFEDNGQLTDEGMASIGLYGEQYNILMNQADRYAEEIKKLEEQMAKEPFGPDAYGNASNAFNQDIIDRYYELIEAQQEAILSAEDMKNAIKDMVEEGIDLELEHLDDLIDKYLEALQAQKDLYDYSSEIEDKTQDIASIEKQLSAYANDNSEETKAIVQQLTQDLEEAQKDLADAEYERQISDIERLLDQFRNDYETILNMRLDNIDALMQQMIDYINANSVQIGETINSVASDVGYKITDETQAIWDSSNGTQDVLKMYGEGFLQNGTTIANTLEKVNANILTMVSKLDSIAQQKIEYAQQQNAANTPVKTPTPSPAPAPAPAPAPPQNNGGGDGVARVGDRVKFVSGRYYNDSYGSGPTGSHGQGGYVYITSINGGAPYPYHISSGSRIGSGDLGWLRLDQLSGYATGKRKIDDDGYAWTQEDGPEMIVRPSDGAILTPLAKNDSVLNADATRNVWNMANDPAKFVKDNLGIGDSSMSPVATGGTTNYTQNLESVVFSLPNVRNYEELLSSMQKDKNFERLISSMTIDKIAGKNAGMKKSKAIR